MGRSNRKFNIPRKISGTFCARGVGNLNFVWLGWGKLNRRCPVSNDFFLREPKSITIINTCLDEKEEFKVRYIAIS